MGQILKEPKSGKKESSYVYFSLVLFFRGNLKEKNLPKKVEF